MEHQIKGILCKFNRPWYNGTVILPEAFKDCDQQEVPIMTSWLRSMKIGQAKLKWEPDAVYYTASIDDSEESRALLDNVQNHHWRIGLFANQIKRNGNDVTEGKIRAVFFTESVDAGNRVTQIDGEDLLKPCIDVQKTHKKLSRLRHKIIKMEKAINEAQKKLEEMNLEKRELEMILEDWNNEN